MKRTTILILVLSLSVLGGISLLASCGGGNGGGSGADLVSLEITPDAPGILIDLQQTQPFEAVGHYSDGSTQTMTDQVTWSSLDTTVATISNAPGTEGLATCLKIGITYITASDGTLSDTTPLVVTRQIKLPATGQLTSYGPGDDGDLRTGEPWPTPRFTDNGDGTVSDALTGLMWLKDGDCPDGSRAWDTAVLDIENINAGMNSACNSSSFAYTDWRMPNILELFSLVNAEAPVSAEWLHSVAFTDVGQDKYLSSSRPETFHYRLNFRSVCRDGSVPPACYPLISFGEGTDLLWPVRTEVDSYEVPTGLPQTGVTQSFASGDDGDLQSGIAWPNPRFTVGTGSESECITDNLTGLMWARSPGSVGMTWSQALAIADTLCGYVDWRLPNTREIVTLHHFGMSDDTSQWLTDQGFTGVPLVERFWTSTTDAYDTNYAFSFNADMFLNLLEPYHKSSTLRLWPVRGSSAPTGRQLFAVNYLPIGNGSVCAFNPDLDGDVSPMRSFTSTPGLDLPAAIALDTVHREVFVATWNSPAYSVKVYSMASNGSGIAPIRTIAGPSTGISYAIGIAVDTVNDEVFVTNSVGSSITVYPRTADGDVAPLRTITGAGTGLDYPEFIEVDTVHDEIIVADLDASSVFAYSRTADGDAVPLRTIAGANTGFADLAGLALDLVNDEIYVVSTQASAAVRVFPRTADGNVSPSRTLAGAGTGFDNPVDVAVDPVNDEIMVSSTDNSSIRIFSRTADGNVSPLRVIQGSNTLLNYPAGIALAP